MKNLILLLLIITAFQVHAQIPNASFENWDNSAGYNAPVGWDNMNAMTSPMSVYTCMKGTPGNAGTSYLKLVSQTVSGMGVMPGVAVLGVMDMTNMSAPTSMSGVPFTQRPQTLTGMNQYMASGTDKGYMSVILTKWNSAMNKRDTIATAWRALFGMQMSWSSFQMPLTYTSTANPDSMMMIMSASGATPASNSYLYVDTLAFSGSVAGATGITSPSEGQTVMEVYPNPSSTTMTLLFNIQQNITVDIQIVDLTGRIITAIEKHNLIDSMYTINTSDFAKGAYFVKVEANGSTLTKKIVIE